ncbi:MAG: o-succinylbenzoate synthase [Planctomycetes bacterium]|nr:o-succinylbenzoate synthase [Planctomycetota bacterium]MCH9725143.1 o-succinylbenzoate synthase [Planctomycetota bacterium]MCH9774895.1 o-succinylbenzoate synthase [Planctomycetota bacterium]MCH9789790.1 o-succinylbenzoate synthase [Planctomycetota bacterium]
MILDRVELLHVRRRLAHPFRISLGAITAREFVVLLGKADGLTVYGEANIDARPFYAFETVGTVWEMISEVLLPLVLGKSFDSIEDVCQTWQSIRGHEYAKAAVEHLYWDLLGKQRGQSIQQLLGGKGETVEVGTSHSIASSTQEYIADIESALAQGIRRIKIKVQPGWDDQPLALIRKHFGSITLMADANAAYFPEHIDHLTSLDRFDMLMLEQPLPPLDLVHHKELARRINTPLCLDEGAHDLAMVENAVTFAACQIVNIKVGRVGGLSKAKLIHDWCHERRIPLWCGRRTGSGISMASELALATLPGFKYPTDHGIELIQETMDHFVPINQFELSDAYARIPTGPGIGVDVDDKMLNELTIRRLMIKP